MMYTFGPQISQNLYHIAVLKAQLPHNLPRLVPLLHDDVVTAFHDLIPLNEGKLYSSLCKILLNNPPSVTC